MHPDKNFLACDKDTLVLTYIGCKGNRFVPIKCAKEGCLKKLLFAIISIKIYFIKGKSMFIEN